MEFGLWFGLNYRAKIHRTSGCQTKDKYSLFCTTTYRSKEVFILELIAIL